MHPVKRDWGWSSGKKKTIESSFENLGVGGRKKDAVLWVLRQRVSS